MNTQQLFCGLAALALSLTALVHAENVAAPIKPSALWPDDRGEHINAHGGGILKFGDTWYWFGEYRPQDAVPGRRYVSCYSSTDLVNWKFRGLPIDMASPENIGPNWVLERPKVYFNAKTKKFVMYVHIDGPLDPNEPDPNKAYKLARVGVAISDTVDGPYKYLRSFRPLDQESRDIGQFIDDDGTAYLIFESRPTKGFFIAKLSDDYLDVVEQTAFLQAPIEGGALVRYDGLYYILGSGLTGWRTNPNKFATAKDLKGPWSELKDIAPPETKTYDSQSTLLLKVVGTDKTTVIFMGDQWKPKTQWDSRYLWMPVEIGNGRLWLPEPRPWTIDVKSGAATISTPQRNHAAEAVPAKKDVLAAMTLANNYFMAKWPKAGNHDLPKKRPSNIWTRGVYFEGAMALYGINKDPVIHKYATDWATYHEWSLNKGDETEDADNQCAGQTYIDLYKLDTSKPERIAHIRANLDYWTKSPKRNYCTWIDALQMSMPCFAAMGVLENKPEYFEKMFALYDYAKTELGLYNPNDRLWWRDAKFKPPCTSPNGKQCYWSRGNGWVFAALVRVLNVLPATDPHHAEYLKMFKDMSAALLPLQREDGFWNVNLGDPNDFGGPETTGTALFTYGLAWGINKGHLPADTYLPAITKAWNAIASKALHPNGFLGYVQGSGSKPSDAQPVTYNSIVDFDDFGLGCFLLAGSEVHALAADAPTRRVSIVETGAKPDGVTINTAAIQSAIDKLSASGGTVIVPSGVFVSGALFLKPGVNLYLEKGAVLKCSTDIANFPPSRTRIEGHFEENWSPALINADGCDGLQIAGEGTLDGDGQPLWDLFWKLRNSSPDPKTFVSLSVRRARLCFIQNSKDMAVSGITFKDSQFWNLHLYNCQDVVVENCRFEIPDKGSGPSTDGVDIDSSQNVVVRSCYFSVNDDCVCLKGNRYDGLNQEPKSPPVRNVVVENCTFVRGHGALTLGTEAQGISEVEMTDCVVRGKMPMLRLKLRPDTPNQDYRQIRVRNIQLENNEGQIVHLFPYYGTGVPSPGQDVSGTKVPTLKAPISKVSDIGIENISGTFGSFGALSGGTTATVSEVTLRNIHVTVTGNAELDTKGVTGVKFDDVVVQKAPATAQADDQSVVKAAADVLAVVNAGAAYGNLTLPTNLNDATVTWSSANENLVTATGEVTRPKDRDANVVLRATITKGSATASKDITVRAVKAFEKPADQAYLFVHFTFTDEKIYFSLSKGNSALDWRALNNGKPIFSSTFGTMGLRDPYIVRSPEGDTFYLMATDLKWFSGDKSPGRKRYIQVWESHDLVNWSAQRDVLVSPPNAQCTYAPEAVWDESIGAYVVFWTSKLGNNDYFTPMYATTRDFVTFTEAQIWQPEEWRIDSTVTKVGDWYYRFTKSIDKAHSNAHDIVEERSKNLRAPLDQWETVDYSIGAKADVPETEAPLVFRSNPGDVSGDYYYLWIEKWIPAKTYVALRTKSFETPKWEVVPVNFPDPLPKHGVILPITADEAKALAAAYPTVKPAEPAH